MQKAKAYAMEGLEEGGDDPKTAQDVVHALYAKYKKNVSTRRPPRPTQRDQPSPHDDLKKIPRRHFHGGSVCHWLGSTPHASDMESLKIEIRLETQPRDPTAVLAVVFGPALTDDPRPRAA